MTKRGTGMRRKRRITYPIVHNRLQNNYILKCGRLVSETTFVFISSPSALFYVVHFDSVPDDLDLQEIIRDEKWNGLGVRFRRYYYSEVPKKYLPTFKELLRHREGENLWLVQRMRIQEEEEK